MKSDTEKSFEKDANEALIENEMNKSKENNADGGDAPFSKLMKVIGTKINTSENHKIEVTFDSVNSISIGKNEKGDTTLLQKIKSLLSMWFSVRKEEVSGEKEDESAIERGLVIEVIGRNKCFVLFKTQKMTNGGKVRIGEWFPAIANSNAVWPASK